MASTLISIIVPCYNHAHYLQERFDSIFSQVLDDYELIVLDDASQDGSQALLKKILKGKPHIFLPNKANSGSPFKQWERGLRVATGKYIWIAESDDFCTPNFLSSLLYPMESRKLSIAFSKVTAIDANSSDLQVPYWPEPLNRDFFRTSQIISCRFFLQSFMGARNCIPNASAVVFRADGLKARILKLAESVNTLKFAGDWLFWAKLLELYDVESMMYVAEPLCSHRMHEATTRTSQDKATEKIRIREFSSILNTINPIWPASALARVIRMLVLGSWDWSYLEFLRRYQPNLAQKLTGYPQTGLHRLGYFFYAFRRLNNKFITKLLHL